MWTENVTWFSNEEGRKGRIEAGQLADLIVPDRDYFACAENDIADTVSDLTMVGGRIVYGAGDFAPLDAAAPPPAMPDWSPVRSFGGYGNWGSADTQHQAQRREAAASAIGHSCAIHRHDHAALRSSPVTTADLKAFWGALGCSCFAF
jgi:hypothetical protein